MEISSSFETGLECGEGERRREVEREKEAKTNSISNIWLYYFSREDGFRARAGVKHTTQNTS